jgi:anaerobic magnesium-protoporphyrin IX monomethyl ester cyclase
MSEILFGQSYFLRFDPKLYQAMQPYPPLGTLYAASYLRNRGYEVALFDAMLAESEDEWDQAIRSHKPRYAILYEDSFNYLSKMCLERMRQAAFTMLEMAKEQGCTTIVCGSDATDHAQKFMQAGADYVLIGEGEETLAELMDRLTGRTATPFQQILGLTYPEGTNPRRPDIRDLDSLPFPAWDLVDIGQYREIWLDRHGYYSMNMVTTRGCPFHCNWCAKPIWGQRYNTRSPSNVVDEMEWLKEAYHPDHIWFADDILGLKPGWVAEFAQRVRDRQAVIPFKCLNRVDLLERADEIDAFKQAGCKTIWVGAESGSQKILDAMDKGTSLKQIFNVTKKLHAAGIQVGFFLQFGYPGETRQDIELTFEMVRHCDPDDIGVSVSYPLPGTRFFETVQHELGDKHHWTDSSDLAMLYRGPFSTEFYRQLHTVLHKEFRLRKAWQKLSSFKTWQVDPKSGLKALRSFVYNLSSLPFSRLQLDRLAISSPLGLNRILPHLSVASAAEPSPQEE